VHELLFGDVPDELDAVHARRLEIADQDLDRLPAHNVQRLFSRPGGEHVGDATVLEQRHRDFQLELVVLQDRDALDRMIRAHYQS
jgi:hypothetical protein